MSSKSGIEWTEATWNPVTGCTKVSPGCANCYAERITNRFGGPGAFDKVVLHPERLEMPLHWKRPRMVFVNSMSDLFHEDVPFKFIKKVWDVMGNWETSPKHTFQILTKRPKRMLEFTQWMAGADHVSIAEWPRNVWLGVSVENQRMADERIPLLLRVPAAVRFVSVEPLLGPICLQQIITKEFGLSLKKDVLEGRDYHLDDDCQWTQAPKLDWVIVGGESGPGARQFYLEWARDLIAQCKKAMVPCFMKQLGSNAMFRNTAGSHQYKTKDNKGGDPSEWMWDLRIREYPK